MKKINKIYPKRLVSYDPEDYTCIKSKLKKEINGKEENVVDLINYQNTDLLACL